MRRSHNLFLVIYYIRFMQIVNVFMIYTCNFILTERNIYESI